MAISHESDQREDESEDSEMRLAEIRVDWRFFPSTLKDKQETQSRKSTDEHKLTTQLIDITTNILLR